LADNQRGENCRESEHFPVHSRSSTRCTRSKFPGKL
jgi:hypothetical protein